MIKIDGKGFLLIQVKRQSLIKFIILEQNDQNSVEFSNSYERDHDIKLWWG